MVRRVVCVCQNVDVSVPFRGVLFQIMEKSGNDGAIVVSYLTAALWVVDRDKNVLGLQGPANMLKEH